jgi:hypothetical protein
MMKVILLITLALLLTILIKLPISVVSDTRVPFTDSNMPDDEINTSQIEANNLLESATIVITI